MKLLISACLVGENVKYNGKNNKLNSDILNELKEKFELIPICPEVLGGLSIPRSPSEIISFNPLKVVNKEGKDVSKNFILGAKKSLEIAKKEGAFLALLKSKSPSCSNRFVYDGSFSGRLIEGMGVAAEVLNRNGIKVFNENEVDKLISREFHPFAPFIFNDSKILILGTFPSIASFKEGFFYMHPRNKFWYLLAKSFEKDEPKSLDEKKRFLIENKIALFDVIFSCKRRNSLDSNLKEVELNDFYSLLKRYPNIKAILFTSRKAEKLFKKNFEVDLPLFYLPSPSPANARMNLEEKLKRWKEVFDKLKLKLEF